MFSGQKIILREESIWSHISVLIFPSNLNSFLHDLKAIRKYSHSQYFVNSMPYLLQQDWILFQFFFLSTLGVLEAISCYCSLKHISNWEMSYAVATQALRLLI